MVENPPLMVLGEAEQMEVGCGAESISLDFDILGGTVHFRISVARGQARLSDIAPLARRLSTKLALVVLERLGEKGEFVPCRKGCSTCCSYLIPLSVPEVFRFREEVLAMPAEQGRAVLRLCLDTAERILEVGPGEFDTSGLAETDEQIEINRVGRWYGGLEAACPLVSDGLCTLYEQRPIVCREHIVTGSALLCQAERTDKSHVVAMPVSVVQALGELAAELEQSDIEAVMLPLALPWAEEHIWRSQRRWPAVSMVERFVEILKAAASKDCATANAPSCCSGKAIAAP